MPDDVCQNFSPEDRGLLHQMTAKGSVEMRQYGANITPDYSVVKVKRGSRHHVSIPVLKGEIGFVRTRIHDWPRATVMDYARALERDSKVMCIGSSSYTKGTQVKCYVPVDGMVAKYRFRIKELLREVDKFNGLMERTYKGQKGLTLRASLDAQSWGGMTDLERKRDALLAEIGNDAEKIMREDCEV